MIEAGTAEADTAAQPDDEQRHAAAATSRNAPVSENLQRPLFSLLGARLFARWSACGVRVGSDFALVKINK